jgi:HD-GYP domain-containing protein (c-di-GMP phosphodiesterase class II)
MTADIDRVPLQEVRDLLRLGEQLPFRVLDLQERLLLNAGHLLVSEAQFEALVDRGAWAERELVQAERLRRGGSAASGPGGDPARRAPTIFDRWEHEFWRHDQLSRGLARQEQPAAALSAYWQDLRALIDADPDIALYHCLRLSERRFALYAQRHAIHCAVVGLLAARLLGWSPEYIDSLACAALTMNLSMLELQAQLAEQEDPPNTRQRGQIRAHPEASEAILRSAGVTDEVWLSCVLQHHENAEGTGYPRGLKEVEDAARLLRAADVYMAKISPRAQRPAMSPLAAMRQLFQELPGDRVVAAMLKSVGVHPPGALVQLASGEVAIVVRRPTKGAQPQVATLSDRQGRPVAETQHHDSAVAEFAIKGPLEDARLYPRVLPERVYGLVPA